MASLLFPICTQTMGEPAMDREGILTAVSEEIVKSMGLASVDGLDRDTRLDTLSMDNGDFTDVMFKIRRRLTIPVRTMNDHESHEQFRTCSNVGGICDLIEDEMARKVGENLLTKELLQV